MPKPIGILYVATEANPFIKTGSIGELAGTLPKVVRSQGHDIRVMLPGYSSINSRRFQIHTLLRMKDIDIPGQSERAFVKSSYLNSDNQKVLVYFLANDHYFSRDGLYCHPDTKKYFEDNDDRFIFFCRGVLEALKRLRWQPDIIHCHDWQCGLIPAYLKSVYKNDPFYRNMKTVFTVYSLASHGTFPKSAAVKTGMPEGIFESVMNGKFSFLSAGLAFADVITTFGMRAEKGLRLAPQSEMEKILNARKTSIVSMNESFSGTGQGILAEKFIDVYRGLTKSL